MAILKLSNYRDYLNNRNVWQSENITHTAIQGGFFFCSVSMHGMNVN